MPVYPLTVKNVYDGSVTVFVDKLGSDGTRSDRFSVPKAHIPKQLHDLLIPNAEFNIITAKPYNTHTWDWAIPETTETVNREDEVWGDMTLICEHLDSAYAHFRVLYGDREVIGDYACSVYDLPKSVHEWAEKQDRNTGYDVYVPKGMIGDPKQWGYRGTVSFVDYPETPEDGNALSVTRPLTLVELQEDLKRLEFAIDEELGVFCRRYGVGVESVEINPLRTVNGPATFGVKIRVQL